MMGRFLSLLPKTVIITLFASLFVGLIVNPALAAAFVHQIKPVGHRSIRQRYPILNIFLPIIRPVKLWRAFAAREYLLSKGIAAAVIAKGRGEDDPRVGMNAGVEAWENRRVEVRID